MIFCVICGYGYLFLIMPYNKKETHTLDFDVTLIGWTKPLIFQQPLFKVRVDLITKLPFR